eukprot:TRINITY_DN17170_c0_g3_i4.p1 TRINITY_DN17170_c0_g3~~TRINITY_DN17170_c0_g3_i4.p1  ORF type:complete len:357 (+),score=71.62 TRINITY_DN17170_c0_g3_i4:86-1156(+)
MAAAAAALESWSVEDVCAHLAAAGLAPGVVSTFRDNGVEGTDLARLQREELRTELAIPRMGDRKAAWEVITSLKAASGAEGLGAGRHEAAAPPPDPDADGHCEDGTDCPHGSTAQSMAPHGPAANLAHHGGAWERALAGPAAEGVQHARQGGCAQCAVLSAELRRAAELAELRAQFVAELAERCAGSAAELARREGELRHRWAAEAVRAARRGPFPSLTGAREGAEGAARQAAEPPEERGAPERAAGSAAAAGPRQDFVLSGKVTAWHLQRPYGWVRGPRDELMICHRNALGGVLERLEPDTEVCALVDFNTEKKRYESRAVLRVRFPTGEVTHIQSPPQSGPQGAGLVGAGAATQ